MFTLTIITSSQVYLKNHSRVLHIDFDTPQSSPFVNRHSYIANPSDRHRSSLLSSSIAASLFSFHRSFVRVSPFFTSSCSFPRSSTLRVRWCFVHVRRHFLLRRHPHSISAVRSPPPNLRYRARSSSYEAAKLLIPLGRWNIVEWSIPFCFLTGRLMEQIFLFRSSSERFRISRSFFHLVCTVLLDTVLAKMPTRKIESSNDGNREAKSDKDESVGIRTAFEKLIGEKKTGDQHEDFELPRYLKKMKYSLYVPIKRNIYLTKRRIEDDGIFCSCNSLSGKSTVCGGDCHCGMLFSSCSSSCKCGSSCNNKPFQHRPVKKLKLVKTKKCGFGLITDEDIKTGDFVIEYVGEVIDDKTCEERLWTMKHRGDTNFYLCEVNHDMVIDATYKGNRSRFINHSCEPNTEMQKWTIEGETRIGIFATRNIKKGDNLTYDYQFVQFGADQDCFCGALSCRQKLGSKFSKLKESDASFQDLPNGRPVAGLLREAYHCNCIDVVIRIWNPQHKKYYGGVIIDFDSCTCKHTILFEDERIEKVDMSKQDWAFL